MQIMNNKTTKKVPNYLWVDKDVDDYIRSIPHLNKADWKRAALREKMVREQKKLAK